MKLVMQISASSALTCHSLPRPRRRQPFSPVRCGFTLPHHVAGSIIKFGTACPATLRAALKLTTSKYQN
jgi:hypothetical protein